MAASAIVYPTTVVEVPMRPLTAPEKLMQKVIFIATQRQVDDPNEIKVIYSERDDYISDAEWEVRGGDERTELPAPYSRHYESEEVAVQALDGSWVGFTRWFGGGKHGEPAAIPWIEDAYDLDVMEIPVMKKVFTKRS